jgi:hypothetical protein
MPAVPPVMFTAFKNPQIEREALSAGIAAVNQSWK